jgi:hypothetical protein
MRRYERPDLLWFTIFSLLLFLPLSFIDLAGGGETFAAQIRKVVRGDPTWRAMSGMICLGPILAVPAAGFGWWAQGVAVRWGLRLTGRPDAPHRADYDDAPPAGPPTPPAPPATT